MDQGDGTLSRAQLVRIHSIILPWPKNTKLDWSNIHERDPESQAPLIPLLKPIWKNLSEDSLTITLPSPNHEDYLEQCCALMFTIDQSRGYLKRTDQRWVRAKFDPICEALALQLHAREESPYRLETWLKRGWPFEHYIARIIMLWAPLVHSEQVVKENWDLHETLRKEIRQAIEQHEGTTDPYRETEDEDSRDTQLFAKITAAGYAPTTGMFDFMCWWLRMILAHWPINRKFGRYPYQNDQLGRDFAPGELEWTEVNSAISPVFSRLDEEARKAIRKDVEEGVWTPLKLDFDAER